VDIVGGNAEPPWQDGAVATLLVAVALLGMAVALELNRELLIRRVTSRSLGALAPGYAATNTGFRVYAGLVAAIGIATLGGALTTWSQPVSWALLLAGIVGFSILTVVALTGEARTYRALKR
jgi:uncharacterized membrane protein